MFRVSVTVKTTREGVLVPVLIELKPNRGRIEWAPKDDPNEISEEDSTELSPAESRAMIEALKGSIEIIMRRRNRFKNAERAE